MIAALIGAGCGGSQSPANHDTATTTTTRTRVVQVWFLDKPRYDRGSEPDLVPVSRTVPTGDPMDGALAALVSGPTSSEAARGLRLVSSGAVGVSQVRVERSTALVELLGKCRSGGSTVTIASLITTTLKQFSGVAAVKVYDPNGRTEDPDVPGDSIPVCLEP
jgi:hypothetical protein